MNRTISSLATTFFLFAISAFAAFGQCAEAVKAEIPFDFYVRDKMLKSGKYIIEPAGCATSSPSFTIRDTSGKFVTSIFPSAYVLRSERSLKPTLNFDNFGATYVLTSLRGPAGRYSIRLLPTRRHAELARRSGPGTYVVNLMKAK